LAPGRPLAWTSRPTPATSLTASNRAASPRPTRKSCAAPTSPATPPPCRGFWAANSRSTRPRRSSSTMTRPTACGPSRPARCRGCALPPPGQPSPVAAGGDYLRTKRFDLDRPDRKLSGIIDNPQCNPFWCFAAYSSSNPVQSSSISGASSQASRVWERPSLCFSRSRAAFKARVATFSMAHGQ